MICFYCIVLTRCRLDNRDTVDEAWRPVFMRVTTWSKTIARHEELSGPARRRTVGARFVCPA